MSEWFDKVVRHVLHTPPSCLSGFVCEPITSGSWANRAIWTVTCRCGESIGRVLGYQLGDFNPEYKGGDRFIGPLAFRCSACDRVTEVIDTKQHGYNSEIGKPDGKSWDSNYRGTGERVTIPCPGCKGQLFSVTTEFGHQHFDLVEDEPELEPRAKEYFDSFALRGRCVGCGKESVLTDFELA